MFHTGAPAWDAESQRRLIAFHVRDLLPLW